MKLQTMLQHCGLTATVAEFASRDGRTVQISGLAPDVNPAFVTALVQAQGYYPVPAEHASEGVLEFTNSPTFAFEIAENVEGGDPAQGESSARTGRERGNGGGAEPDSIDLDGGGRGGGGNGRGFKVLKDGETHKFAQKIFTSVLNNNNMAQYGAFLYDVDHLFGQYYVEPEPEDYDDEGGGNGGNQGGGVPVPQNNGDTLGFEGASVHLDHMVETASNRSAFLKAMMKLMSGDNGERLANAFVGGDAAAFAKAFQVFADKAVSAVPKPDAEGGDDDAGDDNGDDDSLQSDDTGDVEGTGSGDSDGDQPSDGNLQSDGAEPADDTATDGDTTDDDGEPNGDNAGGVTDRSSSGDIEDRLNKNKTMPKAEKPGGITETPRVVVRIPANTVGDSQ